MGATTGERQIGNTLQDIAPNHRSRYEYAINTLLGLQNSGLLPENARVLDAACGCGYGSKMLADAGFRVVAVDRAEEAANYQKNFAHENVTFVKGDILGYLREQLSYASVSVADTGVHSSHLFDAVVSLETIEHILQDKLWLKSCAEAAPYLVGTVPNQDVVPFDPDAHKFHVRHYTKQEITDVAQSCGYTLSKWATQYGKWKRHEMVPGTDGMTLGFLATRDV